VAQIISEIWSGLRDAGLPEVMLYLDDNSASRCHWDDTAVIGGVRVALLADQDRKIVRILPIDSCTGIGVASPKGVDPSGYKPLVQNKLRERFEPEAVRAERDAAAPAAAGPAAEETPTVVDQAPAVEPPPPPAAAKPDPLAGRWPASKSTRVGGPA